MVQGVGFRVYGSGFRVKGGGCRVSGFRLMGARMAEAFNQSGLNKDQLKLLNPRP